MSHYIHIFSIYSYIQIYFAHSDLQGDRDEGIERMKKVRDKDRETERDKERETKAQTERQREKSCRKWEQGRGRREGK